MPRRRRNKTPVKRKEKKDWRQAQYEASKKQSKQQNVSINVDFEESNFWGNLLKSWHRLSTQEKIGYVIAALIATGLTVTAIYYLAPLVVQQFNSMPSNTTSNRTRSQYKACSNFTIYGDPKKAKRIFVGEFHYRRSESLACIDELSKGIGKHMVLVESAKGGKVVDCEGHEVNSNPNRICKGWNHPRIVSKSNASYMKDVGVEVIRNLMTLYKGDLKTCKDKSISIKDFDHEFDKTVTVMRQKFPFLIKASKDGVQKKFLQASLPVLEKILLERSAGNSYSDIFQESGVNKHTVTFFSHDVVFDLNDKQLHKSQKLCAEAMLAALREEKGTTIVLAGSSHIPKGGNSQSSYFDSINKFEKELEKEALDYPYATLKYNEEESFEMNEVDPEDQKEGIEKPLVLQPY